MRRLTLVLMFLIAGTLSLRAQGPVDSNTPVINDASVSSSVPLVVRFSGSMKELNGTIASGTRTIAFGLYKTQTGESPLWSETQTVSLDEEGRYTVLLGAASPSGVPATAFAAGEPQWIGVTPDDGVERPRIEIVSVPYAMKAADADTLGGKSAADFVSLQQWNVLLSSLSSSNPSSPTMNSISRYPNPVPPPPTPWPPRFPSQPDQAPSFESISTAGPSFISDATSGPPLQVISSALVPNLNVDLLHGLSDSAFAKLGENNVFPESQNFPGGIVMPANNPEPNATRLVDSSPLDFLSSSSDPQNDSVITQRFRWASHSISGTTAGPLAQLSLMFGENGATPSPTGLALNSDGTLIFAPGQQLPTSAVVAALSGTQDPGGASLVPGGTGNPIVQTALYSWDQTPPQPAALQVGPNTITLIPCPKGVNGTDAWHYLYISGTGTPEVILITGGSCVSRLAGGTINFTAQYPHPCGYSIGSATDGIQEAAIDADVPKTAGQISRQVMIDPGTHLLRARLSIRSSSMTINSSGATLMCAMSDTCIMLGDPSNANMFNNIVLQGLRVVPGVKSGTWPAVEDNAQGSDILSLAPAISSVASTSFGSLVQVDNDQAADIDGLTTAGGGSWGRCDTTFCSTAILGPGPYSTNAGVLWVKNANLSLQCVGNGIDNQDGNTLSVSNSVVQGYAQFGIRAATVYSLQTVTLQSTYEEEDGYCNPLGTGSSGLIVEGGAASATSSPSAGLFPVFANTGSTQYFYYVVVHSSTLGTSPMYMAGSADTNGAGSINVLWNRVGDSGNVTYDVLRQAGDGGADMAAPYGTGLFAVAVGVPATLCSNAVCSVVDQAASPPSSYTVATNTPYWPALKLWPGKTILTTTADTSNNGGGNPTMYFTDQLQNGSIINSAGATYPSVFAQECNPQGLWTSISEDCLGGNSVGNDYQPVVATLMQIASSQSSPGGLKGRLIFELPPNTSADATHVITLSDSNPAKTEATPNNRPAWDDDDSYIGYDQVSGALPSNTQISIGAPVSISRYIGNHGDGVSYRERLTAAQDEYNVPILMARIPFAGLASLPDGTELYCLDCKNSADDGVAFDSTAVGDGHGTRIVHENGQWRVH
ncbi:MAG: hypothetical protein ABSA78_22325 [Candidatus Sulfotelmatobacter sp.]|jgi:hypothetical protein